MLAGTRADATLKESDAIFVSGLAPGDPDRYEAAYGLALMRLYRHEWPAAIALLEPIYAVEKNSLGVPHLWPLMTQSDLAWAEAEAGSSAATGDLDMAMTLAKPQPGAFGTRASFLVDRWIRAALALHRDDLARALIAQQQGLVGALDAHPMRAAMLPCYQAELLRRDPGAAQAPVAAQEAKCRAELLVNLPADHPFVKDVDAQMVIEAAVTRL